MSPYTPKSILCTRGEEKVETGDEEEGEKKEKKKEDEGKFEEKGKFEEEGEENENVHNFLEKRRVEKSVISIEDEDDLNMIIIADGFVS